jgi:hypothetical protein
MPPWYAPSVHTETPNLAVRTPTTNRDYPDHFQTSLVTASNLPGVGTETEMPNQLRRDGFVVRTPTTNRVTPLQPGRGRRSPLADRLHRLLAESSLSLAMCQGDPSAPTVSFP